VYALPPLALVWALSRGGDPRVPRARVLAFASGVVLGIELAFWHKSIALIGVGLATVLANVQVVVVATVAWVLYGERPGIGTALIIGAS
jgi:drug/metabolite transporter (DMT)-like permease